MTWEGLLQMCRRRGHVHRFPLCRQRAVASHGAGDGAGAPGGAGPLRPAAPRAHRQLRAGVDRGASGGHTGAGAGAGARAAGHMACQGPGVRATGGGLVRVAADAAPPPAEVRRGAQEQGGGALRLRQA